MLHAFLIFASEAVDEAEPSKAPFYITGGLLAAWAVVVSLIGIKRHENWPGSEGAARGIMAVSAVLVVAAMAGAVISG
ncbi:MAG: hypothetical protein ACR2IP_04135 [Solirubrobacteraceae bacterium]